MMGSFNSKMANKATREKVVQTLNIIEMAGGPEALKVIKTKIPAYTSMQWTTLLGSTYKNWLQIIKNSELKWFAIEILIFAEIY